jgi:hypothetical protein
MADLVTAGASLAATEVIKKCVTELYNFLKLQSETHIVKWRADKGIEDLYQHIDTIRKVKTIWQIDKSVDLREFYVPPHVRRKNSKRIKISSFNSFENDTPILLEGIAGQGKSTLLRYLCAQEMVEGDSLPIFIELRRVKRDDSIFTHIFRYLDILGLKLTKEVFLEYLDSGKLTILLDGFDEVEQSAQNQVIQDIELICQKSRSCKIIVTSRPGQTIKALPCLESLSLENLIKDEFKEVIYKISDNRDYADALIKVIDNHNKDIKGILCTPLLVTLLVVSYKSYQQIPEQLSDFYDSLFRVLLQRHDGTKPAYSRPRITKLNDLKFREVFELFCYLMKKHKKQVFDYNEIINTAQESIQKVLISATPEDLIKDITDVTCLIVSDGDEWRFIHKSIQEYFAASHIKNQSEIISQKIYSGIISKYRPEWATEIYFLSEIDFYRYAKYYFIPATKKTLGIQTNLESAKINVNMATVKNILGCYCLEIIEGTDAKQVRIKVSTDHNLAPPLHKLNSTCATFFLTQLKNVFNKKISTFKDDGTAKVDLATLLASQSVKADVLKFVEQNVAELYSEALKMEEKIKKIESDNFSEALFD